MTEYFRVNNNVAHERFDDNETVVVNLNNGCYYSLRGTADAIWLLATSGQSQRQILQDFCSAFSGGPQEIANAVRSFIDRLVAEQLLERTAEISAANGKPPALGGVFVAPSLEKYEEMEQLLALDPIHESSELGWPSAKPPPA